MPSQYRVLTTHAGIVAFEATERGLRRLVLPEKTRTAAVKALRPAKDAIQSDKLLPALAEALARYFAGERVDFDVRFDWTGHSNFDVDTWRACARIPYGETASYKSLAEAIGCPGAARAVGTAMAHNPCPVVIPCHRVLKSDGSIGGYSGPGGINQKRRLLDMEAGAVISRYFMASCRPNFNGCPAVR